MTTTGLIFDLKKYCVRDGPGIRTTVFFKGCPLNCLWCHNPESRSTEIEHMSVKRGRDGELGRVVFGRRVTIDEIMFEIMQDWIFYDQSGGGVTLSGGEPLLQIDFLLELLAECRQRGVRTAVDTSGYAPREDFLRVAGAADLILYDLKLLDDSAHRKYVGVSNGPILENLKAVARLCPIIIRLPLIPGITDTDDNLDAVADYLEPLQLRRISLLPYNKLGEDKRERYSMPGHRPSWTVQDEPTLQRKMTRLETRGFEVSIGG